MTLQCEESPHQRDDFSRLIIARRMRILTRARAPRPVPLVIRRITPADKSGAQMPTLSLESMEVEVAPALSVQLAMTCATDSAAIAAAIQSSFATLGEFMAQNKLVPAGAPRVIYAKWGPTTDFTLAFPIVAAPPVTKAAPNIAIGTLAGGRALRFVHRGPYDTIRTTYGKIDTWLRERGAIKTDADWARYTGMWEEYLGEPGTMPDSELSTNIYLPLGDWPA
jgi:effector-binding domain-containing protein